MPKELVLLNMSGVPKVTPEEAKAIILAMKSNLDDDDDVDYCCASDAVDGVISQCSKSLEKVLGIYDPEEWGDDEEDDEGGDEDEEDEEDGY